MKKGDNMKKQGFTIIEVALVLAIAGLIFLMMMIALPALQRQQRDTARREDIDSLIAGIKKYQTNNRGTNPGANDTSSGPFVYDKSIDGNNASVKTTWRGFLRNYMDESFEDPSSGSSYKLYVLSCVGSTEGGVADRPCSNPTAKAAVDDVLSKSLQDTDYTMYVLLSAKCANDESVGAVMSSNPRKIAILYKLEGGGLYCANT